MKIKNKLLLVILGILVLFISKENVLAETNETYFVVTAYYSPLPDQEHYSYSVYTKRERTYQEEKRLQWEGIRWASWKKVFSWMLAAPKNYKFWTKIYLEWLWVWEVSDRWGAIVNKWVRWHGYDRIDVWMWYGDEWLRRATYWWKRTVKWTFLAKTSEVTLNYNNIPSPSWVIKSSWIISDKIKEKIITSVQNNINIDIFTKKLTKNIEFKKLQKTLIDLKLFSWAIDGDYNKISNIIYDFQLNKEIVKSKDSPWAGLYWPITRKALKEEFEKYLKIKEQERLELARIDELKIKFNHLKEVSLSKANKELVYIGTPKFWDISHWVRGLQVALNRIWYFNYKDTAIYWNITKESIIKYQLDKEIISSKNELWAWVFWPKTKNALKNDLMNEFLNELVKEENIDTNDLLSILGDKIKKRS